MDVPFSLAAVSGALFLATELTSTSLCCSISSKSEINNYKPELGNEAGEGTGALLCNNAATPLRNFFKGGGCVCHGENTESFS